MWLVIGENWQLMHVFAARDRAMRSSEAVIVATAAIDISEMRTGPKRRNRLQNGSARDA